MAPVTLRTPERRAPARCPNVKRRRLERVRSSRSSRSRRLNRVRGSHRAKTMMRLARHRTSRRRLASGLASASAFALASASEILARWTSQQTQQAPGRAPGRALGRAPGTLHRVRFVELLRDRRDRRRRYLKFARRLQNSERTTTQVVWKLKPVARPNKENDLPDTAAPDPVLRPWDCTNGEWMHTGKYWRSYCCRCGELFPKYNLLEGYTYCTECKNH